MTEFEEVYRLYFRDVYRYCLGLTRDEALAEEITQETFFKALKSLDQFDGKCRVYVWLCQIAKNTYFTHHTKEKRREELPEDHPSGESLEEKLLTKEAAFEIHRILHRLEEPYKEVFSLRTFGELPFRQIGELFGKSDSWARLIFFRAKKELILVLDKKP